jgi:hypothetical protein
MTDLSVIRKRLEYTIAAHYGRSYVYEVLSMLQAGSRCYCPEVMAAWDETVSQIRGLSKDGLL